MAVLSASVLAETLPRRASIAVICAFRASISARRAAESLADAACALAVAGMSANAEHVVTSVVIFRFIGSPFREPSGPMNGLYEDNVTRQLRLCDAFMATDRKSTRLNSSH